MVVGFLAVTWRDGRLDLWGCQLNNRCPYEIGFTVDPPVNFGDAETNNTENK